LWNNIPWLKTIEAVSKGQPLFICAIIEFRVESRLVLSVCISGMGSAMVIMPAAAVISMMVPASLAISVACKYYEEGKGHYG
jgi:hypothetical protein